MRTLLAILMVLSGLLALSMCAQPKVHAQAYSDTPTSDWFKQLSSPFTSNCCDQADCKLAVSEFRVEKDAEGRVTRGDWWALSNRTQAWVRIDPRKLTADVSVFAKAVLCEGDPDLTEDANPHYEAHVYCFAPPPTGF